MTEHAARYFGPTGEGGRFLKDDPDRWPLLTRATRNTLAAESVKIEWVVDSNLGECECCGHDRVRYDTEHNFMQIFRTKVGADETVAAALRRHFDEIETALRNGLRRFDTTGSWPTATMGGVIDLLGRWPRKGDYLALKVLRRPTHLIDDVDSRGVLHENPRNEWISEVSLMARRGDDD